MERFFIFFPTHLYFYFFYKLVVTMYVCTEYKYYLLMKYDDFSSRSYHNYIYIITSYDSRQNRTEQSSLFRRGLDLYQVKAKRTTITIYIVHVHTIHLNLFCPELFSLGKGEGEGARGGGGLG